MLLKMKLHKKSLGQHFLHDRNILQKIVGAAELTLGDTVLEVGPGEGTLTEFILPRAGKVIAVEKDARLIPILQQKFSAEIAAGKLELVHGDILTSKLPNLSIYKLVANLPYYITGAFLKKFLQSETQPSMMVLLLQKEVARRIVAADGKESILSISVKCYGAPKYINTVKAGSFSPPPKVGSAIIKIAGISKKFFNIDSSRPFLRGSTQSEAMGEGVSMQGKTTPPSRLEVGTPPLNQGRVDESEQKFFAVLKKGFAHPRKLLSSNLGLPTPVLLKCGISANARAENVSLEQWKCLTMSRESDSFVPVKVKRYNHIRYKTYTAPQVECSCLREIV